MSTFRSISKKSASIVQKSLLLALLLHLSTLAAVAQSVSIHQLIEGEVLALSASQLFPAPIIAGTFAIVENPRHGTATVSATDVLDYAPDPSYTGFDDFTVEADSKGFPALHLTIDVKLRVLPRALPVAGRFDGTGFDSPAYYDTAERVFHLCQPWDFNSTFSCLQHGVPEAPVGWLPVVGDWDGDGDEFPSLFDPTTGTLHLLKMESAGPLLPGRGPDLKVASSTPWPSTTWTWPVAGDWDGDGLDRLAFYDVNGTIRSVESGAYGLVIETWDAALVPLSGDALPWPVTWHTESTDALGVVNQLTGEFRWLSRLDETRNNEPIGLRGWGRALPMTGENFAFFSGEATALLRFDFQELAGERWHHVSLALPGTPSTLPLHFPNDPPG